MESISTLENVYYLYCCSCLLLILYHQGDSDIILSRKGTQAVVLVRSVGLSGFPLTFCSREFCRTRILDVSALCVSPLLPVMNRTSHASCSYLTSGNTGRPQLIFTFERWPYNQM